MRPLAHPAGLFSWNLGKPMRAYCACTFEFPGVGASRLIAVFLADQWLRSGSK